MELFLKRNANDTDMIDVMTRNNNDWTVWATVQEDFLWNDSICLYSIIDELNAGATVKMRLDYDSELEK